MENALAENKSCILTVYVDNIMDISDDIQFWYQHIVKQSIAINFLKSQIP